MHEVKRTEIDDVLNKAAEGMDSHSAWPGMTYEEGVHNAIQWILGDYDANPMDE